MARVEIYATPICPYCTKAKTLLSKKGVEFTEIDVFEEPRRRVEMLERSGGRKSVPQVFIGGTHVGGYDDLQALENAGRLDALLVAA